MRWASLGVPVHLLPLCPVSSSCHVFILLSLVRARVCTFALTLALRLPSGRRVCVPLVVTGILVPFFPSAGGSRSLHETSQQRLSRSACVNVPAWCTWANYKMQLVATFSFFPFSFGMG